MVEKNLYLQHSLKRLTVSMRCVMFVSETVPKRQNLRGTKGRFGYQLALVKKKKKKQKRMNEEHFAQIKIKRKIQKSNANEDDHDCEQEKTMQVLQALASTEVIGKRIRQMHVFLQCKNDLLSELPRRKT
ncbi:hypothetical protein T12_7210 [Trichinella patagoniensis]|uniref:Uncharacterized protein n=1 Tax=Trichinella patagoniensis TaxID=990121 RepID=A0A0V1AGM5_9BILA|nr:hypothetical protein T12_7210 [Trichinella patagoniensis]